MKFSLLAEAALRLLYPESCNLCKKGLNLSESTLCNICAQNLESRRIPLESKSPVPGLSRHWALYSYETPAKDLLRDLKFSQKTWLLKAFRPAFKDFTDAFDGKIDLIVPVPLHRSKLMMREFNQSLLIAKVLSKKTGVPIFQGLKKKHATPLQSSLSKQERSVNLWGAFKVSAPVGLVGKNILLVDDILTTGATAGEAARTLKSAGARHVELFTIARTKLSRDKHISLQTEKAEVFP